MRLYRVIFWGAAAYHLLLALGFGLAPDIARRFFRYPTEASLFLIQVHGLLYFLMACGLAYVAERPSKSIALAVFAALATSVMPAFAALAWFRGQLGGQAAGFYAVNALFWLPVFLSYIFWFFHVPRPSQFLGDMGVFGKKGQG